MRLSGYQPSQDRGAAAVEFALLVPLLVFLLLALLQYGLWYSDSIALRHGAREAARAGAVNDTPGCDTGGIAERTACIAEERAGTLGGSLHIRVQAAGDDWTEDGEVTVCLMAQENQLVPLAPLPDDRLIRTEATYRIEVDNTPPSVSAYSESAPPGADWSWCG